MDTKILILIICILFIVYSLYVIITRYKKYKKSTDPGERTRRMTAVVLAGILILLVVVSLINFLT